MTKSIHIAFNIPTGAKAQDTEWLVSDYYADDVGKYRCNLAISTNGLVQYTVDGGTTWLYINKGSKLKANSSYGFDIYTRAGDLINFKCPDIGGTTLLLGRLDTIKHEG